jgi:beta-lactamase class A
LAASVIKTLLLCEALRQADSPTVTDTIAARQVAPNESVWTFDSPSLQPPYLSGQVPGRTKLEAAITHSDYTSTDMAAPELALIRGGLG